MFTSPIFPALFAASIALALPVAAQEDTAPEKSIVRVNATLQNYSFLRPWEKGAPTPRRGLGAVLEGNRVLITAEMCVNSTFLELEHPSSGARSTARIAGIDYEANLAVIEAVDPKTEVFKGLQPLRLDESVVAGDTCEVWQIEDNGNGVSTDVEVLRVDVGRYFIPGSVFLVYQVKGSLQARTNSFTLPVVKNGKLAGMLLAYSSKEQTASVLPAPVIKAFLADLADGAYAGFPNLGISLAPTLDETLREFTGIADREGGIFVREVSKGSSAEKAGLKKGDVILKIAGQAIDPRGNYDHPRYGKLSFSHLVRGAAEVGDKIQVELVRDGEPLNLEVVLARKLPEEFLVDPYMFDRGPKYIIFGGLIFQELTQPYLESWGDDWNNRAPFNLVYANAEPHSYEEEGRDKLVFLSNVLKTPSTLGYEGINSVVVTKVNGSFIKNIGDLSAALAKVPANGLHTIEFDDYPMVIYVDDRVSRQVNQELLQYGIGQLERLD